MSCHNSHTHNAYLQCKDILIRHETTVNANDEKKNQRQCRNESKTTTTKKQRTAEKESDKHGKECEVFLYTFLSVNALSVCLPFVLIHAHQTY